MSRVHHERWDQTQADLRRLALTAPYGRTRERFLALHNMAQGTCATQVAERTGCHPQTVMEWPHSYNEHGSEALAYQRTSGRPPLCPGIEAVLGATVRTAQQQAASPPAARADPLPRWTLKRLAALVRDQFGRACCRETVRAAQHRLGLSWKNVAAPAFWFSRICRAVITGPNEHIEGMFPLVKGCFCPSVFCP